VGFIDRGVAGEMKFEHIMVEGELLREDGLAKWRAGENGRADGF
jgi:hypothetical protein